MPRAVNKLSEKYIQSQILKWIASTQKDMEKSDRYMVYWRQNSGTVMAIDFRSGRHRMVRLGTDGLPDIMCIVPYKPKCCCGKSHETVGKALGLEVKSAKGRLRQSQKDMAERFTNAGAPYFVVRSLEDAKNAFAAAIGTRFL